MCIDRGISCGASQVFVLAVRNMKVSLRVPVLLGQAKINDVDLIATLTNAHQKVIGFDVAMDKAFGMDVLDSGDELVGKKKNCLQRKFAVAKVEEILQTGSEEIDYHGIIVAFRSKPTDEGNTNSSCQGLVDPGLILELRMLGLHRFELDCNFFARNDVCTKVDVSEGTGSNLAANTVFITDAKILLNALVSLLELNEIVEGAVFWGDNEVTVMAHRLPCPSVALPWFDLGSSMDGNCSRCVDFEIGRSYHGRHIGGY